MPRFWHFQESQFGVVCRQGDSLHFAGSTEIHSDQLKELTILWGPAMIISWDSYGRILPKARAVFRFSTVSWTRFRWGLDSARAAPCHHFCLWFSWTGIQGLVMGRRGEEGCSLMGWGSHCCFYADDVVLMASSVCDLQHSLDRFTAEGETARMRISTSKSEALVLSRKLVDCPLQVGNESLPQEK